MSSAGGYELSSLRDKIKRVQENLAKLAEMEERRNDAGNVRGFDGGRIIRNYGYNRLQIEFDAIPDAETRARLKQNGFRWSPMNNAWQRQLTQNAERAARLALDLHDDPAPSPAVDEAPAEDEDAAPTYDGQFGFFAA